MHHQIQFAEISTEFTPDKETKRLIEECKAVLYTMKADGDPTRVEGIMATVDRMKQLGATNVLIDRVVRLIYPRLTTERKNARLEVPAVIELEKDSEINLLLLRMESGKWYRTCELLEMLIPGSRFLIIETPRGRETALGSCLNRLAKNTGRVIKASGRHALYSLSPKKKFPPNHASQ